MKKALLLSLIVIATFAILGYVLIRVFLPNVTITSWYRTPWKNKAVGGLWNSRHLWGWGYDIVPVNDINKARLKKIFPIVIDEQTHLHTQWI